MNNMANSITSKFLNFNLIWNEGIAFGLFSFNEKLYYNFLDNLYLSNNCIYYL